MHSDDDVAAGREGMIQFLQHLSSEAAALDLTATAAALTVALETCRTETDGMSLANTASRPIIH